MKSLATKREVQGGEERQSNMMREDARRQVVAQWPAWAEANNVEKGTGRDALLFFNFLQDKRPELLAPVYGWFTEGFDTRDLKEAKVRLDELSSCHR